MKSVTILNILLCLTINQPSLADPPGCRGVQQAAGGRAGGSAPGSPLTCRRMREDVANAALCSATARCEAREISGSGKSMIGYTCKK